ncbi:vasorin [Bombina bombina]|uniref:vasorin n=1 Tax=Bombina bombina TaxID=8345 RepID=UPI00235ADE6E|nr:vasorin [Bombina bombina]XP_053551123.1 vasorin [Bombina bombina]
MQLLLWSILLIGVPGFITEGCPNDCQCNQPQTVFCLSRKSSKFPSKIPHDTVNLYVFENGISSVEEDNFSGLWDLQLLDISYNKLSSLPDGIFRSLTNLSNLDLSSNYLTEISADTFQGLSKLERLYLNENNIQSIHQDAFKGLESLLELKLKKNKLVVPPVFSLPHLLLLDLSYNIIPTIQPGVFNAPNIETLLLAGLGLKEVSKELLFELKNLHELDISDNQLDKVPVGLHGLTKLNIAGNIGISQLHIDDFSGLPGLQDVDLSRLSLRTLPRGLFRSALRLRAVSLAQNPFNCVCSLGWLAEWLRISGVKLLRPDETRCHFPPKNAGKTLRQLRDLEYGCPPPTTTVLPTTTGYSSTIQTSTLKEPFYDEILTTTISTTTVVPQHKVEEDPTIPAVINLEDPLCPPHTCLNGGFCSLDPFGRLECECPQGFYGLYCEIGPVTPVPAVATEPPPVQLQVLEVTSSSLRVDLQSFSHRKANLKGIRLTLHNLSGSNRRPLVLSLPSTLFEYTVRSLEPNNTYRLCLGSLGDGSPEDELCTEAQTTGLSLKHSAQVIQSQDANLTLVLVPAVAAGILLAVIVASAACYARRRRLKEHAGEESGPLEMEGVKNGLEGKGELKKLSDGPVESEEPLMDPTKNRNNNDTPTGQLPHSYF